MLFISFGMWGRRNSNPGIYHTLLKLFSIGIALAGVLNFSGCREEVISPIVIINGEPVHAAEFDFYAASHRGEIYQYFSQRYQSLDRSNIWDRRFGEESPLDMLKSRTIDHIVRDKTVLKWAQEAGLIKDISHQAFLDELLEVNDQRKMAVDSGQIIYGPIQWNPFNFYQVRQSKVELKLKNILESDSSLYSSSRIREVYEFHKNTVFSNDSLRFIKIFAVGNKIPVVRERLKKLFFSIKKCFDTSQKIACIPEIKNNAKTYRLDTTYFNLGLQIHDGDNETRFNLTDDLRSLKPGESGEVIESLDSILLFLCLNSIKGFQPLSETEIPIRQIILDTEFQKVIGDRIKKSVVKLN